MLNSDLLLIFLIDSSSKEVQVLGRLMSGCLREKARRAKGMSRLSSFLRIRFWLSFPLLAWFVVHTPSNAAGK